MLFQLGEGLSYFGLDRVSGVRLVLARLCDSLGVNVVGVIVAYIVLLWLRVGRIRKFFKLVVVL